MAFYLHCITKGRWDISYALVAQIEKELQREVFLRCNLHRFICWPLAYALITTLQKQRQSCQSKACKYWLHQVWLLDGVPTLIWSKPSWPLEASAPPTTTAQRFEVYKQMIDEDSSDMTKKKEKHLV